MRRQQALSIAVYAALAMIAAAVPAFAQYEPIVGQPHADFVLPTIDTRQPVALSQFRGKKVILIHFASW